MYTDCNNQTYKLVGNKAIIQHNNISIILEIFPTITVSEIIYEVVFPNDCEGLFKNEFLEEFKLHKLLNPTTNIVNTKDMFFECKQLKYLDLTNLNTENVVNMSYMFYRCLNLIYLNISSFNTSNVTQFTEMFGFCKLLTKINVSSFNTEKAIEFIGMFGSCYSLKSIDITNFNTENVKSISGMFECCESLTEINFSSFNLIKIYDLVKNSLLGGVTYKCKNLKQIDLNSLSGYKYNRLVRFICYVVTLDCNVLLSNVNMNVNTYIYDINCNNSIPGIYK